MQTVAVFYVLMQTVAVAYVLMQTVVVAYVLMQTVAIRFDANCQSHSVGPYAPETRFAVNGEDI